MAAVWLPRSVGWGAGLEFLARRLAVPVAARALAAAEHRRVSGKVPLVLQSEDSPPLIDRLFEHGVDSGRPIETFRCGLWSGAHCCE